MSFHWPAMNGHKCSKCYRPSKISKVSYESQVSEAWNCLDLDEDDFGGAHAIGLVLNNGTRDRKSWRRDPVTRVPLLNTNSIVA